MLLSEFLSSSFRILSEIEIMNRKKRIVIISVIVGSLLLCIIAAIVVNRDGKAIPLAVTFRNENGRSVAKYEIPTPTLQLQFFCPGGALGMRSYLDAKLSTYSEGAWHSQLVAALVADTNDRKLECLIPTPTNEIWKLRVTSSASYTWIRRNGMSIGFPFRTDSQSFESQVFTNVFSAINQ